MMRPNPLHAPDGLRAAVTAAGRPVATPEQWLATQAVVSHERLDDGLVHNHNWAAERPGATPTCGGMSDYVPQARAHADPGVHGDGFDDGLVHNHGWASRLHA